MSIYIYLSNLAIFCITCFLGTSILVQKNIRPLFLVVSIIILSLFQFLFNATGPNHFSSFFMLILFFLLYFMFFEGPLISKFMLSIFSLILVSISEFISMLVFTTFFCLESSTSVSSYVYACALLLSNLFFFLFVILFKRVFKKYLNIPKKLYSWLILIVPLSTLLLFFNIPDYFQLIDEHKAILLVLILLVLSNLITFYLFCKVVNSLKIQEKLAIEKQNKKRTEIEFSLLSQNYNSNFNLLHTLLHSYSDLYNLLKEKKYLDLEKALNDLSNKTFKEFNSIYSESLFINSIINSEIEKLRKYNIGVRTKVDDIDMESISLSDKMDFFRYLLSSCIDVVAKIPVDSEKIIYIKSNADKEKTIIKFFFNSDKDYSDIFKNDINLLNLTNKLRFKFFSTFFVDKGEIVLLFVKFNKEF